MNVDNKKEILFYYESKANPNGDPGFDDQPRLMNDGTIMVTDLRLKRTIRDHAKNNLNKTIFVDYDKNENPIEALGKARELLGAKNTTGDVTKKVLDKCFDSNLFGHFIPVPEKDRNKQAGNAWYKMTGPVQFGLASSVNQPNIIHPSVTSHFVGKVDKTKTKQFSTIGSFFAVDYALIKFSGGINPSNLGVYNANGKTPKSFDDAESLLADCIWDGTNGLSTRSKYPQRSVFYLEVTYDKVIHNDLSLLVDDSKMQGTGHKKLAKNPIGIETLVKVLKSRSKEIKEIKVRGSFELEDTVKQLKSKLPKVK